MANFSFKLRFDYLKLPQKITQFHQINKFNELLQFFTYEYFENLILIIPIFLPKDLLIQRHTKTN